MIEHHKMAAEGGSENEKRKAEIVNLLENERGIHERSLRSFDQYLTGLSATALTLSITYYNSNWERLSQIDRCLFAFPVVMFLLALLAVIFSQLTSSFLSRAKIRLFRAYLEQDVIAPAEARLSRERWNTYTETLNKLGIGFLVIGLFALALLIFSTTITTTHPCTCTFEEAH